MNHVVSSVKANGIQAVRVFPRDSQVLVAFADRLANDVVSLLSFRPCALSPNMTQSFCRHQVGEYIIPLLSRARGLENNELFLQATAASFVQAWRIVPILLEVGGVGGATSTEAGKVSVDKSKEAEKALKRMSLANGKETDETEDNVEMLTVNQAEDVMYADLKLIVAPQD